MNPFRVNPGHRPRAMIFPIDRLIVATEKKAASYRMPKGAIPNHIRRGFNTRILILEFLRKEKVTKGEKIQQALGFSERTVQYAIRDLKAAGFPIKSEAGGGYRYTEKRDEMATSIS